MHAGTVCGVLMVGLYYSHSIVRVLGYKLITVLPGSQFFYQYVGFFTKCCLSKLNDDVNEKYMQADMQNRHLYIYLQLCSFS